MRQTPPLLPRPVAALSRSGSTVPRHGRDSGACIDLVFSAARWGGVGRCAAVAAER